MRKEPESVYNKWNHFVLLFTVIYFCFGLWRSCQIGKRYFVDDWIWYSTDLEVQVALCNTTFNDCELTFKVSVFLENVVMYPQSNYLLFGMEYAMYVCLLVFAFAVFCFVVVFVFDCYLFVHSLIHIYLFSVI
jgi:hypothetical protein